MRMDRATSDYLREEQAKIKRLTENRREQERLREKLAMLEKEESKLDREVTAGKSQGMVAVDAREKAAGEVKEWREKIMELKNRAETLLKVMREMSGKYNINYYYYKRVGSCGSISTCRIIFFFGLRHSVYLLMEHAANFVVELS